MATASISPPPAGKPRTPVPNGACDTHTHIFGPFAAFPPLQPSSYPLPAAGPAEHRATLSALGVKRGIIVQPAPYADDPSAMLAAIAASDGTLKGVAVAGVESKRSQLERWAEGGIAGLRFTEARTPSGERYAGSEGFDALESLAPVMRDLGLHAQLWAPAKVLADAMPGLLRLKVPLVLDHMAMLHPDKAESQAELASLLPLIRSGDVWVKLVLCRIERADLKETESLRQLHEILLDARPDRMLWGSDWPYVRLSPAPDAAAMLDVFARWAGDEALVYQVLCSNPAALYGFEKEK